MRRVTQHTLSNERLRTTTSLKNLPPFPISRVQNCWVRKRHWLKGNKYNCSFKWGLLGVSARQASETQNKQLRCTLIYQSRGWPALPASLQPVAPPSSSHPVPTPKLSFLELGFHTLLPKAWSLLNSAILTTWMVWPAHPSWSKLARSLALLSWSCLVCRPFLASHSPSPYFRHVLLVFHFFIQLALPNLAS